MHSLVSGLLVFDDSLKKINKGKRRILCNFSWLGLSEGGQEGEKEKMASKGLEPLTLGSEDRCSNPLSYEA
jgi:hypothetical protein